VAQTMKNVNVPPSRPGRPGQRQQERLMRAARRRRRLTIVISSIVAVLIVIGAIVSLIIDARYNADVAAKNDAQATATAAANLKKANAQATASAVSATATANAVNAQGAALVQSLQKQYPKGPATPPVLTQPEQSMSNGLKYIIVKEGTGPTIKAGDTVAVEYTGWIQATGKKFDSSFDNGAQPLSVTLTQGQIINGWVDGVPGMKIGETRRLIIPPSLGYGSQAIKDQSGKVVIPANSTLIFDVTPVGYGQPSSTSGAGSTGSAG
jgi:FKBP-type peptidyl-prolyl cis-trans isomerases 1